MLPKENRVDVELFDKIFKEGKSYHSDLLQLKTISTKDQKMSRFAFVVPKKIAKKAVIRNKLRRQGYEIVGDYLKSTKPTTSSIFILKKNPDQEKNQYQKEVIDLLKKASII